MRPSGFTLAEVLIALALLGVVAAFAIPKILQTVSTERQNAVAKEVIATVSEAYELYKKDQNGNVPATMTMMDLLPYMNVLSQLSNGTLVDDLPNNSGGSRICGQVATPDRGTQRCYLLPNGAALILYDALNFGGTTSLNEIEVFIDPDGRFSGINSTVDHPGRSTNLMLYYNGRISNHAVIPAGATSSAGPAGPSAPEKIPSWFHW